MKKNLKKIMACLTVFSAFTASTGAIKQTEPVQIENNSALKKTKPVQKTTNSAIKKYWPYLLIPAIGLVIAGKKINENTEKINEENLKLQARSEVTNENYARIPQKNKDTESELNVATDACELVEKIVENFHISTFDVSDVDHEKLKQLIEKIVSLISDDTCSAYNMGSKSEKKAIVEQIAKVIKRLVICKGAINNEVLDEMIKLDTISGNVGKEGILGELMKILDKFFKYIDSLELFGLRLFDENKKNSQGLKDYLNGVMDYLIPTTGTAEELKLAKLIKNLAGQKKVKEFADKLLKDKIRNDILKSVIDQKIEAIDKVQ